MLLVVLAACGGNDEAPAHKRPEPEPLVAIDAGPTVGIRPHDPSMHLDDVASKVPPRTTPKRIDRRVELLLRSTPSNARVFVDGAELGRTPQLWEGPAGQHEFTFVLADHALARYRFHVITTGVVHAPLVAVVQESDAGVPPPELVPSIAPPPTVVSPVEEDASPRVMAPLDAGAAPMSFDAAATQPTGDAAPLPF